MVWKHLREICLLQCVKIGTIACRQHRVKFLASPLERMVLRLSCSLYVSHRRKCAHRSIHHKHSKLNLIQVKLILRQVGGFVRSNSCHRSALRITTTSFSLWSTCTVIGIRVVLPLHTMVPGLPRCPVNPCPASRPKHNSICTLLGIGIIYYEENNIYTNRRNLFTKS